MLLCGTGIIIYSLWLEKKWDQGIAKFPHRQSPLTPWYVSHPLLFFSTTHTFLQTSLYGILFLFDELRLYHSQRKEHINSWLIQEIQGMAPRNSNKFCFFFPGFRFIFTFLGVGIVVCLSTVGGHIIANRISNSTLLFVSFLLIINITRKNKRDSEAFQALSFSRTA